MREKIVLYNRPIMVMIIKNVEERDIIDELNEMKGIFFPRFQGFLKVLKICRRGKKRC